MKISEYILALEVIQAVHEDLEVECLGGNGTRKVAPPPNIAYRKILSKRESREEFWEDWFSDHVGKQGEKVCKV